MRRGGPRIATPRRRESPVAERLVRAANLAEPLRGAWRRVAIGVGSQRGAAVGRPDLVERRVGRDAEDGARIPHAVKVATGAATTPGGRAEGARPLVVPPAGQPR